MANLCEVCGKSTSSGMNVSHSHIRTRKTWKPNIQRVRAVVDGATKLHARKINSTCTLKQKDRYQMVTVFLSPYYSVIFGIK